MHWIVPPKQKLLCVVAVYCLLHSASYFDNASAQTAPITSSGLNTQISGPIPAGEQVQYDITGGTRAGQNLFHSFGEFGVPNHTIANFHNNSNPGLVTANILARVTGGNESQIFGTIRTSEFSNANLFLMNRAGFLFGPDATVNVGGMASFTSADYLQLSDGKHGGYFYADPAKPTLLTAYPVAAFGFLGSNPGAITVHGSEFRATGISLVGGDITIESGAQLSAPNGKIQLASTASPGKFDATSLQSIPNVNKTSFTSFGSITLAPESTVNLSGTDTVSIRAGQFVLSVKDAVLSTAKNSGDPGTIVLNTGSTINTTASGTELGGTITLKSERSLALRGSSSITTIVENGDGGLVNLAAPSIELKEASNIKTDTSGIGKAGNVELHGNQVNLSSESRISTRTQVQGHGGDIAIRGLTGDGSRASDIHLSEKSRLVSETIGDGENEQGHAGHIRVETARLNLSSGSRLNTTSRGSTGDAGDISVHATESVIISGSGTQFISESAESSSGDAGDISITAPSIIVERGGSISSNTGLSGDAGTILVNTNSLQLLSSGRITSSSLVESETPPSGPAGAVTVKGLANSARSILIDGSGSGIFTETKGEGLGGNITLTADTITMQNGGTLSAKTSGTQTSAIGGTIEVKANRVQLRSGAVITANSNGMANAGDIKITAADGLTMQSNSEITTEVKRSNSGGSAGGGNIAITTSPEAIVYIQDSKISASVADGPGGGGDIKIDPQFVVLQNSRILAQADQDTGGRITIITSVFQKDAPSVVNADSKGGGVHGTVRIQAPYAPGGGKIQPLGNRPLQAASLLNQRCAAVAGGKFSSFTVARQNSLPTEPGGWISSPVALATPESEISTIRGKRSLTSHNQPTGERSLLSLRQIAPPGFLTKAFAGTASIGCAS